MRTDPLLGRLIDGKYQIDAEIGAGGMATIYRATRLHIGDVVAVKVLHSQLLREPMFAERFKREAQAAARLKHPNVVAIYDFGVSTDGIIYIVMELVEGVDLRTIIKDAGPMPAGLAAEIVRQVCAALAAAHGQGVVHRDIKPANIAVETTPDGPRVKVLDFGIVSLGGGAMTAFTQTGAVLGTPAYMSPEQCLGEELDGRSDIDSLGVVLFEMLCGVVPFNSPTPTAVAIQHVQQVPPPLRVLNASISSAVEGVVSRALAKRPEDRFQTARELADALTAAVRAPRIPFAASSVAEPAHPARLDATIVQAALQPVPPRAHPLGPLRIGIAIAAAATLAIGAVWLGGRQLHKTSAGHANVESSQFSRISKLQNIGVTLYYPRYVPARFALSSVERTEDRQGVWWVRPRLNPPPIRHNYELSYCDRLRHCFRIASITWLDEDGCLGKNARILPGRSRYFGELEVCTGRRTQNAHHSLYQADAAMAAWIRSYNVTPAAWARTGPPIRLRFYGFDGSGLTDREAVAILESLTPLR